MRFITLLLYNDICTFTFGCFDSLVSVCETVIGQYETLNEFSNRMLFFFEDFFKTNYVNIVRICLEICRINFQVAISLKLYVEQLVSHST